MGICHYCFNCGRCRGEKPKEFVFSICLSCGYENDKDAKVCAKCGKSLILQPGITNTIDKDA